LVAGLGVVGQKSEKRRQCGEADEQQQKLPTPSHKWIVA
jgi:hypothetical protein